MLPEHLPAWETVEAGKTELLRRAHQLSPDVFAAPRGPEKWSYAQTLHHLALAEGEVTGQIETMKNAQTLPKAKPIIVTAVTALMNWGVPLPAPPHMLPADLPLSLADIETLWGEKRAVFKARLNELKPGEAAKPIALHSIAGPMNARQVLALAAAHQRYHLRQFPP